MFVWSYVGLVGLLAVSIVLLARKWQMKPKHVVPWLVVVTAICSFAMFAVTSAWPQVPPWLAAGGSLALGYGLSLAAILYCFFRDPERTSPGDDQLLVSPADGTIVYIKAIEDGRFPFAVKGNNTIPLSDFADAEFAPHQGLQIGIAMNFLNVHVNRSPLSGVVKMVRRIPGDFASLRHIASLLENERMLLAIENEQITVGMVQIASRLVRRIVPYVEVGQRIAQGERVGMIRFGSQVDLLIPAEAGLDIVVQVGDEVTAGESVLVRRNTAQQLPAAARDDAARSLVST
jgi:phosphatidylserine decarboxylase